MQNPRKLTATLFLTLLCAAVLAVALPGAAAHADLAEQLGSPSNSASLDQISGSMESWNKAQLLHLGMRSTPARLKLIADAQNYIFITVPYRFDDEESTWAQS
jgi:hypothetical protein